MRNNSIKRYNNEIEYVINHYNIHLIIDYESSRNLVDDLYVNLIHLLIPPVGSFCNGF